MEKMENIQKCFFLFFNRGDISGEKLQKCNLALFPLCSRITALIPQSFWGHCKHPYNLTYGNHVTAKDRPCNTCFNLNCHVTPNVKSMEQQICRRQIFQLAYILACAYVDSVTCDGNIDFRLLKSIQILANSKDKFEILK